MTSGNEESNGDKEVCSSDDNNKTYTHAYTMSYIFLHNIRITSYSCVYHIQEVRLEMQKEL